MSEITRPGGGVPPRKYESRGYDSGMQVSAWTGWIGFAAIMMILVGSFHLIQGLIALLQDDYFLVTKSGLSVHLDYTTWGWIHLIGGLIVVASGIGLFAGKLWARIVGVLVALLSALINIGFLAAFPIWSTMMIAIDVVVIWALTVHGGEMRDD